MRYGWTGVHYLKPQNLPRRGIAAICGSREHTVSNFWQIPRFIISWMPTALGSGQQINRINSVCIVSGAIKTPPFPSLCSLPLLLNVSRILRGTGVARVQHYFDVFILMLSLRSKRSLDVRTRSCWWFSGHWVLWELSEDPHYFRFNPSTRPNAVSESNLKFKAESNLHFISSSSSYRAVNTLHLHSRNQ